MDALRTLLVLAAVAPVVPAQAVTVTKKGSTLSIKGSAGIDVLSVSAPRAIADGDAPEAVSILITPDGETTVNGSSLPAQFPDVLSIKITLGGGNDELEILDLIAPGIPLTVNAGAGDDQVAVANVTAGSFKCVGGAGDDSIIVALSTLEASKITDTSGATSLQANSSTFAALTIKTGALEDVLSWTDVTVSSDLVVSLGGEEDVLTVEGLDIQSEAILKLGAGNDSIVVDDATIGGSMQVVAGTDDDTIVFIDSVIGGGMDLNLGSGINALSLLALDSALLVAGSVTVKGSADADTITLDESSVDDALTIGEDLVLLLKSGSNELQQDGEVTIGRDLLLTGGALAELLAFDQLAVSHDATFQLANGTNSLTLLDCDIGNDLTITAGLDDDTVQLTGTNVGGTQTIELGGGET